MAITIDVTRSDLEHLYVTLHLTGLTVGTKYDLMRVQYRYSGMDDVGARVYGRETPDRLALWSAVAHRVGWEPTATTANIKDYECPRRPTKYFIVPSSAVGPFEYTNWKTPYPLSRGVLSAETVHFDQDLTDAMSAGDEDEKGHIVIRSTENLGQYVTACVAEMDEIKYVARGTELAVMGSQYPVYVADTREARRGSIVFKVNDLGEYNDLRGIVFPPSGIIRPVVFNAGTDPTMLLDDMRVIPLDVSIEQATQANPNIRFVRIDYVEVNPAAALVRRVGDNDDSISRPDAHLSISDTTPARGQYVTLTDTSTGQYDSWDWTIYGSSNNVLGKHYGPGPYKARWASRGKKKVKLRVYGAEISPGTSAGSDTIIRTVTVH